MEHVPKSVPAPVVVSTTALAEALPERLRHVDDTRPGYTRHRPCGRSAYFDTRGGRIHDPAVIARINKLTIPSTYTDVWICPRTSGHLQAAGCDACGHKQYRYHTDWCAFRDVDKYRQLLAFRAVLPWVRGTITAHLEVPGLPREKTLATVVYLLDVALVHVDSAAYARDNRSYGLTTLRNRHVEVHGNMVRFQFHGKSGVEYDVSALDPHLARIIRRCVDLPGQELLQYIDEAGECHAIDSTDVNVYLQEISGADFTAKSYRIWAGSMLTLDLLRGHAPTNITEACRQVVEAVTVMAQRLGNTSAACHGYYVYPAVVDAFPEGGLEALPPTRVCKDLRREEAALLRFLEHAVGVKGIGEKRPA